jgi:hypothetical protein
MHPRRFATLVAALALGVLALPSAAKAEQFCYGDITPVEATPERDTGVAYEFTCREPVRAFSVTTSVKLSAFDVAADVFDPPAAGGAIRGDDRFSECEGAIPSFGFTCGTGGNMGFGRWTRATFDTDLAPCARDRSNHIALAAWVTVQNLTNGRLSGPFALGKPKGCAAPAKKAKKKAKSS